MSLKYKDKREEGFTIIEVLIVLAIAGLIILIVFLAIPALQRNSRNLQRKDDVSRIVTAFQECRNNNGGRFTGYCDSKVLMEPYIEFDQLEQIIDFHPTTPSLNEITAAPGKCNAAGTDTISTGPGVVGFSYLYLLETRTGTTQICANVF